MFSCPPSSPGLSRACGGVWALDFRESRIPFWAIGFGGISLCFLAPRALPGPLGLLGCSGSWISENPGPLSEPLVLESFRCVSLLPGLSRAPRAYWGVLGPGFPRIPDPSLNHWFWSNFSVFPCSPVSPGAPGLTGVFWGLDFQESRTPLWTIVFEAISLCFLAPRALPGPPGLLRCSGALCYVQKPYVLQTLCSKTVCFTNLMLCYVQKPFSTNPMLCSKTVCSTNPMLYSKTVCSTNPMFQNRMFYKPYAMLCYVEKPYVLQTLCYVQKLYVLQTLCSTNRAFSKNSFLENIWSPHLAKQRSGERPRTPVGLIARALYGLPRSRTSTKCGVLKW